MRFLPGSGATHTGPGRRARANERRERKKLLTPAQSSARDYGDRCSSCLAPALQLRWAFCVSGRVALRRSWVASGGGSLDRSGDRNRALAPARFALGPAPDRRIVKRGRAGFLAGQACLGNQDKPGHPWQIVAQSTGDILLCWSERHKAGKFALACFVAG